MVPGTSVDSADTKQVMLPPPGVPIEGLWEGCWYRGLLQKWRGGLADIIWEDGTYSAGVPPESVRPAITGHAVGYNARTNAPTQPTQLVQHYDPHHNAQTPRQSYHRLNRLSPQLRGEAVSGTTPPNRLTSDAAKKCAACSAHTSSRPIPSSLVCIRAHVVRLSVFVGHHSSVPCQG